jgi:hypothetical protein
MNSAEGGLQSPLRKEISTPELDAFVPYLHCPPHQPNLILNYAAEKARRSVC